MKYLIAVTLFIFSLTSCTYQSTQTDTTEDSTATVEERVGAEAIGMGTRYLDLIFTEEQCTTKIETYSQNPTYQLKSFAPKTGIDKDKLRWVLIFLHGGDSDMDCRVCNSYGKYFARLGYVVLSLEYSWEAEFDWVAQKASVYDVFSALQWVRENQSVGHVDGNKVFLMGSSAGAITAYQSNIAGWSVNEPDFRAWATNPNNKGYPVTVLGSATISGAATGIYEKLIPKMLSPNCFYTGENDTIKVPASKQIANYNKMVSSRVPHMNEIIFKQVIFPNTGHVLGNFDFISKNITQQFYSLINLNPVQ